MATGAKLEDVLDLVDQLSAIDKVRVIEHVAPQIERELAGSSPARQPLRSLYGVLADLGPAPSADEIDEVQREMWANFPRDDI